MSDQHRGDYDQYQQRRERDEQRREQMLAQRDQQRERNNKVQGATGDKIERADMEEWIAGEYRNTEQPGLHPANRPSEDSKDHKSVRDLEDLTGNPGHRGANPNAPATSINPAPQSSPVDEPYSINEPPGSEVLPPEATEGLQDEEQQDEEQQDDQGEEPRALSYNPPSER